jgi:hypothetical protein
MELTADGIVLSTVVHNITRHGIDRAFSTGAVTFASEVRAMEETGPLEVSWKVSGPEAHEFGQTHTGLQPLEAIQMSWPDLEIKTPGDYAVSLTVSSEQGPAPSGPQAERQFKVVHPLDSLNETERGELRRFTGDNLNRAYTAFVGAIADNRAAAKDAAKESPDFLGLLIEIGLGFMLPALAKGIAELAKEIPEGASTAEYRIALAALDEERTKKALEIGVKVGKESLKGVIEPLKGEDEIDQFLIGLDPHFHKAIEKIDGGLPGLSDEELGVVCAAYSEDVANRDVFRASVHELLEKYKKEVQPIGKVEYHWMNEQEGWTLARVVFPDGASKLAVLSYTSGDPSFSALVEPELEQEALEKFKHTPDGRYRNGEPESVPANHIDDVPLLEWSKHLHR